MIQIKKQAKKLFAICMAIMLFASLALAGCASEGSDENIATGAVTAGGSLAGNELILSADTGEYYSEEDLDDSWDEGSSTIITLSGGTADISGSGASFADGTVTISAAGTYVLSGALSEGQIVVNAGANDLVRLVLSGVDIHCSDSAAIYSMQADKTVIILAAGTSNSVSDGESYNYAAGEDEPDAAIFSKGNLSITGTGSLTVNAGFNNGIGTKDDLRITAGNIDVTAVNHAIRGRDSVAILDGSFLLVAGSDGIQSNNDEDTEKGWIVLNGGSYAINAVHDGIQAETSLAITGGTYNIATVSSSSASDSTSDSYKGIKAGGDLAVSGGEFTIITDDDCVHANGSISIGGGSLTLSSGDDGVHADGDLTVSGGEIDILASYEGLEAATINILDGIINIVATDDGVNAAGGADANLGGGRFGQDSFAASDAYYINIGGGTISLVANGDGLDSNGSITISGGLVVSLINSSADEGAIDCDGALTVTGGTVIYGGTGTGRLDTSSQSYVLLSGLTGGRAVSVQKDGSELLQFTPSIDCGQLIVSSPEITADTEYEIYVGGSLQSSVMAGTGASDQMFGGMGGGMGGGRGGGGMGGAGEMPSGDPGARPDTAGTPPDMSEMPDRGEMPSGGETPPGSGSGDTGAA